MRVKILAGFGDREPYRRATKGSAGLDLRAATIPSPVSIYPGEQFDFNTGIAVQTPPGQCALLLPRSGLARRGVCLVNPPGLIDSDYTGPIIACLWNRSPAGSRPVVIEPFDFICQLVRVPVISGDDLEVVDELEPTERGAGGFGSTDK